LLWKVPAQDRFTFSWIYLEGMYFWISENRTDFETAGNACSNQPGSVRLAVLDATTTYDAVSDYLYEHHRRDTWIDATRPSGTGDYTWGNGSPLHIGVLPWKQTEPHVGETHARLYATDGMMMLAGIKSADALYAPLCQSVTPPPLFGPAPDTDLTWVALGSPRQMYGFSTTTHLYYDAKATCEQEGGGSRLAVLHGTFCEVSAYIRSHLNAEDYWVGLSRPDTSFSWTWHDGTAVDNALWYSDTEPDPSDLVAFVESGSSFSGLKATAGISTKFRRFVCEKTHEHMEWTQLGSSGQLFSFSTVAMTWDVAKATCEDQAGDVELAVLDEDLQVVKDHIASHNPGQQYWVGATSKEFISPFEWSNGASVEDSAWSNGVPSADKVLASVSERGLHAHSDTTTQLRFICQGKPASVLAAELDTT
ncbi:hypothetical protein BaRGS_00022396, partial [Batillaria attramentaria]